MKTGAGLFILLNNAMVMTYSVIREVFFFFSLFLPSMRQVELALDKAEAS